ncbi:tRNA (cytidine(34)-2'-O)-methyltransferase [uncultured archaeon]|nr:tRNA (cytidine(34)-2'-O)-methyltransferase [uncultured archaeon]
MNLRVVLVEPMYEGNVGSVARAMKNFGFHDLVLVNPCKIEDFGLAMASHARDVLQMARNVSTLQEALEGVSLVVGTTGKRLGDEPHHLRLHLRAPCLSPAPLAEKLKGKEGEVALLLGREDCGLRNEELEICDLLVSIPTAWEYPIMNLSHAAAILFYELSSVEGGSIDLAKRETLLLLLRRSKELLQEVSYPEHKQEFTVLMLRRIFGRAELTEREARTLLGVIKSLRWKASAPLESSLESSPKQDTEI